MVYSRCSIMGNKPRIRFKGFNDDWEQRKFSEITYLSGIKNKENKPYESYSISNEFGFIPQNEQFENGGTMKTADKSMYYIVTQNSFAYNPARINVGSIGYYDKPDNVIVSSLYEVFKTTEIVNDKFLWHWFKSNQFNHLIEKYQEGGVRLYFYYDKLCKGTIELPTIDEQNKISNLLESLDLYITLHQRKLEKLKLNKSALLQKLFPQNGCTIPEVRFKGFTDAWEQRKFSDLYEKISEKNDLSYSLDKIISVANMYYKSDAKVSNEEYLRTYNIFRYGEIAFEGNKSKEFTYGRFVENTIGDGIISHVFEVFRPITKYDIYFWKYYINYEPIMGKVLSRCTKKTTMMTNLVAKDFLKETVFVPSLAEQKQIGILLNTLDKFITLHQLKLDRLMSIKKGLLQQLFV